MKNMYMTVEEKTCEMPNLVSWEFTLESVACKLPRWPVNFQGVAGKFPKKILKVLKFPLIP